MFNSEDLINLFVTTMWMFVVTKQWQALTLEAELE